MERLSMGMAAAALALSAATAASVLPGRSDPAEAVVGVIPALQDSAIAAGLSHVIFPRHGMPDTARENHMISLAYNWAWDSRAGWRRDNEEPSVALTLESWFKGLAELNFDMRPPAGSTTWPGGRALGFEARHDGSLASLTVGGRAYAVGGAGLRITGGTTGEAILDLAEAAGQRDPAALRIRRADGSTNLYLSGGASPHLSLALDGFDADRSRGDGIVHVLGRPGGEPVLAFVGTGRDGALVSSRPDPFDDEPRFRLAADGRLAWGDGAAPADVSLQRVQPNRLATDGELAARGLVLGESGALVRQIRVFPVALRPTAVGRHATAEQKFRVPGLRGTETVLLNGPAQPAGIGIAGIRVTTSNEIAITFVNASAASVAPAQGSYTVLAIEVEPGDAKAALRY